MSGQAMANRWHGSGSGRLPGRGAGVKGVPRVWARVPRSGNKTVSAGQSRRREEEKKTKNSARHAGQTGRGWLSWGRVGLEAKKEGG